MRTYFSLFLCGLLLCGVAQASATSVKKHTHRQSTDQALRAVVDDPAQGLASLSVLAIRAGQVVYQQQFGRRYISGSDPAQDLPANAHTLFRIASVSKMVAAIGAMVLVEQGKLDLDADISRYLGITIRNPDFPDVAITSRMLLSHTSSLRDDAEYNFPITVSMQSLLVPGAAHYGAGAQWAKKRDGEDRAPGQFFYYVNLNWGVLGSVMEAASGQRFDHFMRDTVLRPLHIAGGYNPEELTAEELANLAVLYRKRTAEVWNAAGPWVAQVDDYHAQAPVKKAGLDKYVPGSNASLFSPQGGLRISVSGLSRLMRMLMNQGELDGVRILRPASIKTLLSEQWRYDAARKNGDNYQGQFLSWGLGFQRFTDVSAPHYGDRLVSGLPRFTGVGHLGEAYGLNSGFVFDPKTRNGMIYAIGGVSADSETTPGEYSSLSPWEGKVLSALHKRIYRQFAD